MAEKKQESFEEQLDSLEKIVNSLESGNVPLEESLKQFKTGMTLSKKLQDKLTKAEKTLAKVMDDNDHEQPFEQAGDDPSNNGGGNRGYGTDADFAAGKGDEQK